MSIKFSVAQATLQLLLSLKTFSVCLFYCSDVPKSNKSKLQVFRIKHFKFTAFAPKL